MKYARTKRDDLENRVEAIIFKDEGIPYEEVLETFELTPGMYLNSVKDLDGLVKLAPIQYQQVLEEISKDDERRLELLNMGEEYVVRVFDEVQEGKMKRLPDGIHHHPDNRKLIVYHALTKAHPDLASTDRKITVQTLDRLPKNMIGHLRSLGLTGLMTKAYKGKDQGSPIAALRDYDRVRQEKTGDTSIFNLDEKYHLHPWGNKNIISPQNYWQEPENVRQAIWHALTEEHPGLASTDRKTVADTLENIPTNLKEHLYSLGLTGLMSNAYKGKDRDSPIAVLRDYDLARQEKTGDTSIFNISERYHLHPWGNKNIISPQNYWQEPENVRQAIWHTITEEHPGLASTDRKTVADTLENIPTNLREHLYSLGLGGLMISAYKGKEKGSPTAVLRDYDLARQEILGQEPIFQPGKPAYSIAKRTSERKFNLRR